MAKNMIDPTSKFPVNARVKLPDGQKATVRDFAFYENQGFLYAVSSDLAPSHTRLDVPESHLTAIDEGAASSPQDQVSTATVTNGHQVGVNLYLSGHELPEDASEATKEGYVEAKRLAEEQAEKSGAIPPVPYEAGTQEAKDYEAGVQAFHEGAVEPEASNPSEPYKHGYADAKSGSKVPAAV